KDATNATITGLDQTATGDKVITGVFKQRTISFAGLTGATPSVIAPLSVTGAEQALATPTKTSMFFGGWSFVANGTAYTIQSGQPFTAAYAQLMNTYNVEDLVLTAVWTSKPAVDFVNLTPQTYTYDGTQHAFVLKMLNGSQETGFAITYSSDNSAYSTTEPTSAGTYYVKIYRAETSNYLEYSTVITGGLVIDKATLTKPALAITDYIYNGMAQTATLDSNYDSSKMNASNNIKTNAGTYNTGNKSAIKVAIKDVANYKWIDGGNAFVFIDWTIKQMQLTIAAPTVTSKVYDGNDNAISCVTKGKVSGIVEKDTLGVSVSIATANFNTADVATANQVTVSYTITGDTNHNYIAPTNSVVNATITPATITYNAVGYSNIYDGSAHG
ncbi:MAG: YDG domain-containing protein, partial [Clostridia bacterium]